MKMSTGSLVATFLAGTSCWTGPALAEAAPGAPAAEGGGGAGQETGLADIIVTARRRAENMQNVPVAISAITGDALTKRGIFETTDLSSSTPNLQINSVYGRTQPNFTLRGVGVANEFNSNAASPVGVYVDEVYQAFRFTHGQQLYDLDRIEVLRGPQGTLYGRNTTGGAVNFITQQPTLTKPITGYLTAGAGNFGLRRVEGAVEATLVPDQLGIRLAGTYEDSHGYVKNLAGPNSGGAKNYAFRGTLRYVSPDGIEAILKGYAARSDGGQENIFAVNNTPSGVGPITFGPLGQAFGISYDRSNLDLRTVAANGAGSAVVRAEGAVLRLKAELGDKFSVTSLTGYDSGRYAQLPTTDCDGSPLDFCHVGYLSDTKAFNQELRLNFETGRLKLVGGLFYGWDQIKTRNNYRLYGILSTFRQAFGLPPTYFNPAGFGVIANPAALPTPILTNTQFDETRRSQAIFGEGVYQATDKISLTVGLRYTHDTNHYYNGLATLYDETGAARLVSVSAIDGLVPAGPNVVPLEKRAKSNALSGRAILSYKPTDATMVYASFSRGYRAGSFNGTAFQSNEQVSFVPPEHVNAYEAGIKSRFLDNKLQANIAFFYYDYKGQQVEQIVGARSLTALASLNGKSKGVEAEFIYRPIPDLTLNLAAGYLDTRYNDGQFLSGIPVGGNKFPNAPDFSLNAGFDWDLYNAGDNRLTLHGDTSYTGKYTYDPFGNRQATGPLAQGGGKYWLVNSRLTYTRGPVSVSAWVKNLADKLYFPQILNLEAGYGLDYRIRNEPRTYGAEATFRF